MYAYGKSPFSRLNDDIEAGTVEANTAVRNGFIKKVFGILAAQLLLTSLIGTIFFASEGLKSYVQGNAWTLYLAIFLSFGILIPLMCVPDLAKKYPINYVLLFSFTAVEGYLVGAIASTYDVQAVVLAFFLTAGVTLGLALFAMQTKYDFTTMGGVLFSLLWVLLLCGFVTIFIPHVKGVQLAYAGVGALLFSAYLVYDVQKVCGGRQFEMSVDDYVPAALTIYLDVINIFLYILRLVGQSRN